MEFERSGIPLLTKTNYSRWKDDMEAILDSRDCLRIIKGTHVKPIAGINGKTDADVRTWERLDAVARSLITIALDNEHYTYVRGSSTSKEWWDALRKAKEKKAETDALLANQAFNNYQWQPGQSVTSFIAEIKVLRGNLEELKVTMDETSIVSKVLQCLPSRFRAFKMSWKLLSSSNRTFANLESALLEAEADMEEDDNNAPGTGEAFLSNRNRFPRKQGNRNRGGRSQNTTQAVKGTGKSRQVSSSSSSQDRECWFCGQRGHIKSECKKRIRDQGNQWKKEDTRASGGFTAGAFGLFSPGNNDGWLGDSGAYAHITRHKEWFTHLVPIKPEGVEVGTGNIVQATMKGTIEIEVFDGQRWTPSFLNDVRYVPDFGRNSLFSIGVITGKGYKVVYEGDGIEIKSKGKTVLIGRKKGNIYDMGIRIKKGKSNSAYLSKREEEEEALKWHLRLGHVSKDKMKLLVKNNMVTGLSLSFVHDFFCEGCTLGRMARKPYGTPSSRETTPGAAIHSDVCGPFSVKSVGGSLYYSVFKDEATGFRSVYFMKQKSETLQSFKQFLTDISQTKWTVKKIRTDNGREYVNHEFKNFLLEKGILHECTPAYSPALNGIAERENRTLLEMARAMLISKDLPLRLWAEAVHCASYVMNRVPNRKETTVTPFESWYGNKPDVSHFRIFGSTAFVHVPHQLRKKLEATSRRVIFVGYGKSDKLFRVYDPNKRVVEIVRDIRFQETLLPKLVFLDEEWKQERNETPVQNKHNTSVISEEEEEEYTEAAQFEVNGDVEEEQQESRNNDDDDIYASSPSPSPPLNNDANVPVKRKPGRPAGSRNKPKSPPPLLNVKLRSQVIGQAMSATLDPLSVEDALSRSDAREWKKAMEDEIHALEKNKTWILIDSVPKGRKTVKSKWVFKMKTKPDGSLERYKARLCAKGFTQRDGIDYSETFAPVVRYESIRTIIAISAAEDLEMCQFDIKTAFLYGLLKEEIFMEQPEAFNDGTSRVCKLIKGLYGLKQAPRCWNEKFHAFLSSYGLNRSEADQSVYHSNCSSGKIILGLYVDDGLLCCSSQSTMNRMIEEMSKAFEVKVGDPSCFVGLELKRDRIKRTIEVCQAGYIEKILERYNMTNCTPAITPGDSSLKLTKAMSPATLEEKEEMRNIPYRQAVGSLMFAMVCSRPDIAFEVGRCAQFCDNPGKQHWTRVKRILRFLRGTTSRKLLYGLSDSSHTHPPLETIGYCDSDWGGCSDTRRSTTGFIFTLNGAPVSWSSKMQKTVALSSTEAEYMAASDSTKEAKWIRQLLLDLGYKLSSPTSIFSDNHGAILLSKNPGHHQRTKHIDIRHHFVRQEQEHGIIELKYIPTQDQPADMMTKSLVGPKLDACCQSIHLVDTVFE